MCDAVDEKEANSSISPREGRSFTRNNFSYHPFTGVMLLGPPGQLLTLLDLSMHSGNTLPRYHKKKK